MSPALQERFMAEIMPILVATVPRVVIPVGAEDARELTQDALAEACAAVDRLEKEDRPIHPQAVAFYTIQRLKTGRRSTGSGRTDVLSPGCQLDGNAILSSIDATVETGEDEDSDLTLGDLLASRQEDPGSVAGRQMDWSQFMSRLTDRQQEVVWGTAAGFGGTEIAARMQVSSPRITELKGDVARKAARFWGDSVLKDAASRPLWWRTRYQ